MGCDKFYEVKFLHRCKSAYQNVRDGGTHYLNS